MAVPRGFNDLRVIGKFNLHRFEYQLEDRMGIIFFDSSNNIII